METRVVGIKPPDEKWKAMKKVWDACSEAGVEPPVEVLEFFGDEDPDDAGVVVGLGDHSCVKEYRAEMQQGFEIVIDALPKDVKIIRFYNSW